MKVKIYPHPLSGTITAPSSKSLTHRALICAAFSEGISTIIDPLIANDTMETIESLKNLGAKIDQENNTLTVTGIKKDPKVNLTFKESASSLRMILPYVLYKRGRSTVHLNDALLNRLTEEELFIFDESLIDYNQKTLTCSFNFEKSIYKITSSATSQWASGFLLLLPFLKKKQLLLDYALVNNSYINLTKEVMRHFRVKVDQSYLSLTTSSFYQSSTIAIEGDWSNGAIWMALKYLGEDVNVDNLSPYSNQGDRKIINILKQLTTEATIDLSNNLDLALVLAATAALTPKVTTFTGLKHLTHKESNRYQAIINILKTFEINYSAHGDEITILGKEKLKGDVTIDSENDHRVIMALLVMASRCEKPITILQAEAINKSYPNLYDDYQKLGGLLTKE